MKFLILLALVSLTAFSGEYEKIYNDFVNAKPNTFEIYNIDGYSFSLDKFRIDVNTGVYMSYSPVNGKNIVSKLKGDISVSIKVEDPIESGNLEKRIGQKSFRKSFDEVIVISKSSFADDIKSSYMMADMYNDMSFEDYFKEVATYYSDEDTKTVGDDILRLAGESNPKDSYIFAMKSGDTKFIFNYNARSREELSLTEVKNTNQGEGFRFESLVSFADSKTSEIPLWEKTFRLLEEEDPYIEVHLEEKLGEIYKVAEGRGYLKTNITLLTKNYRWHRFVLHDGLEIDSILVAGKKVEEIFHPEESSVYRFKLPKGTPEKFELEAWYNGEFLDKEKYYNLKSAAWYPKFADGNTETYKYSVTYPADFKIIGNGEPETEKVKTPDGNYIKADFVTQVPVGSPMWEIGNYKKKKLKLINGRNLNVYYYTKQDFDKLQKYVNNSHKYYYSILGGIPDRDYNYIIKPSNDLQRDKKILKELKWYTSGLLVGAYPFTYISGGIIALPELAFDFNYTVSVIGAAVQQEYEENFYTDNKTVYKDSWITIGLSTEMALMFTETIYGENSERLIKDFNNFRIDEFESQLSKEPGSILLGYKLNHDRTNYNGYTAFKAMGIMRMLRSLMKDYQFVNESGNLDPDHKFKQFISLIFSQIKDNKIHKDIFFAAANTVMQEDMSWFYEYWVERTDYPKIEYATQEVKGADGNTTLNIKIRKSNCPDGFFVHVPVKLEFDNGNSFEFNLNVSEPIIEVPVPGIDVGIEKIIFNYLSYALIETEEVEWEEIKGKN